MVKVEFFGTLNASHETWKAPSCQRKSSVKGAIANLLETAASLRVGSDGLNWLYLAARRAQSAVGGPMPISR